MNFHFNEWLTEKLYALGGTYGNFDFEVMPELDFIKESYYKPGKIYIVTKALTPDLIYDDQVLQPYQILILCEENTMELSQAVFTTIASTWNYKTYLSNGTFVKFQFTNPVVMSNFNEVKAGYRTILYMTTNLVIMENIADISDLKIDGIDIKPISVNINYTMSPDTQQMSREDTAKYISKSVKATSGFAISLVIPPKTNSELTTKIVKIMAELDETIVDTDNNTTETINYNGNNDFEVSFSINGVTITKNTKLTAASFNSAPNQVPSLQIGLMK